MYIIMKYMAPGYAYMLAICIALLVLIVVDLITALSGAAAGISSKFVVYPFDTSKRRLQVIGFETARKEFGATRIYTGVIDHLVTATKEEGFRGLYKGASWACIKAGLSTSMYFFIYEKVCSILRTSY